MQKMFNRPRCRDWSPLATQQLRLRNLIQITGHNIVAEPKTSIYFTLHSTLMSAPFFTSERIETFKNAIWAEINCPSINKSTSPFVCVRVWQCDQRKPEHTNTLRRTSITTTIELSLADTTISDKRNVNENDKMLFIWGVYLSGLIPIIKRTGIKLKENALIFYIHGGFFTSAEYLQSESIPKQYNHFHQTDQRFGYQQIQLTPKYIKTNNSYTSKNCDSLGANRNSYNEFHVTERRTDQILSSSLKSSISGSPKRFEQNAHSGRLSPSCDAIIATNHNDSDDLFSDSEFDTTAEASALKIRYLGREFFKSEIRPSYNVKKLLLLQEKQRIYRNQTISSNEVMDKICMKSAFCLNLKLIANKGMLYRPRGNPSIGRTLNRLLSAQPEQPKPEVLLKAQELRRKIETAKFRCRFLTMERDRYKVNLRKLNDKCAKICDENIEKESWLMANYRGLSRNCDMEQKSMFFQQKKLYENVKETLAQRQKQLLMQLKDIYSIEHEGEVNRVYKINGIYLPNADAYKDGAASHLGAVTTSSNICVALGYVAHIVVLCSSILNIPLRNKIIYYGSASKIRDDVKVLSEHDREFPLFCRSIPPADSLLYAVFLLNQNISQIKFMLNIHNLREDIRATLPNLLEILSVAETSTQHILENSLGTTLIVANDVPMSSVSESSIDIIIPVPIKKTFSVSDENINGDSSSNYLLCRSSGSYSDEQLTLSRDRLNRTTTTNRSSFTSEPILSAVQPIRLNRFKN